MTDYEKLKGIIDKIDDLVAHHAVASAPAFKAWRASATRFIIKRYGENSFEHKDFRNIHFSPSVLVGGEDQNIPYYTKACRDGLLTCKAIFETYLEEMAEEEPAAQPQPVQKGGMTKIFIVHGHDGALQQSVARIVEKQGIEAIILSEQANQGRTIIEKFEANGDVGGAICLFTADDVGKAKDASSENSRARQNVVLETGYFMGKLGRKHVVILADSEIEIPSDLSGMVYTNTTNWEVSLLKDLKAMGYEVDFNKLF